MLIRALTSFVGGPPVGSTGEMPDEAAMAHIRAGHAVSVEKLADRAPKIDFDHPSTPPPTPPRAMQTWQTWSGTNG